MNSSKISYSIKTLLDLKEKIAVNRPQFQNEIQYVTYDLDSIPPIVDNIETPSKNFHRHPKNRNSKKNDFNRFDNTSGPSSSQPSSKPIRHRKKGSKPEKYVSKFNKKNHTLATLFSLMNK